MKYLQKCNGDIGKETCRDEGGILLKKYKFDKKLKEALMIKAEGRPVPVSIFIDGEEIGVSGLSLGGIQNGEFDCLVSENDGGYKVEAVAFDPLDAEERHWICLKPAVYDDAVEFFLKNNYMEGIVKGYGLIREYAVLEGYGLDFVEGDTAIKIKLPLMALNGRTQNNFRDICPFLSNGRVSRYAGYLTALQGCYKRVVLLTVCQYGMDVLMEDGDLNGEEKNLLTVAISNGLEFWSARMKYGADGIRLLSYKNMTDQLVLE